MNQALFKSIKHKIGMHNETEFSSDDISCKHINDKVYIQQVHWVRLSLSILSQRHQRLHRITCRMDAVTTYLSPHLGCYIDLLLALPDTFNIYNKLFIMPFPRTAQA